MSVLNNEVVELLRKLKNRKLELEDIIGQERWKLTQLESELIRVEDMIREAKPLEDFVYAQEYLDSLSETKKSDENE